MATASNILKNFNVYIDGKGFAGVAEEVQLPTLEITTEDFRAGGMDGTIKIEMGQEAMEATISLSGYDSSILTHWGVGEGNVVPVVARGALESLDGTVTPIVVNLNGTVRSMEPDAWKAGEKSALKLTIDVRSYKYTQNGQVIHDIDIINMIRIVNGKDRLAAQRNALGI